MVELAVEEGVAAAASEDGAVWPLIMCSVGFGDREDGSTVEPVGSAKTSPSIRLLWPSCELKSSWLRATAEPGSESSSDEDRVTTPEPRRYLLSSSINIMLVFSMSWMRASRS